MKQSKARKARVLIIFNTICLYGMERGVIEVFDLLRPEVEPHFMMTYRTSMLELPVFTEIERRSFAYSLFSDRKPWPLIGRPQSIKHAMLMVLAMIKGNLDVLRQSFNHDLLYLSGVSHFYFSLLASTVYRLMRKRIIYHFHDLIDSASLKLRLVSFFVTD
jgi:hypothetical protein